MEAKVVFFMILCIWQDGDLVKLYLVLMIFNNVKLEG